MLGCFFVLLLSAPCLVKGVLYFKINDFRREIIGLPTAGETELQWLVRLKIPTRYQKIDFSEVTLDDLLCIPVGYFRWNADKQQFEDTKKVLEGYQGPSTHLLALKEFICGVAPPVGGRLGLTISKDGSSDMIGSPSPWKDLSFPLTTDVPGTPHPEAGDGSSSQDDVSSSANTSHDGSDSSLEDDGFFACD